MDLEKVAKGFEESGCKVVLTTKYGVSGNLPLLSKGYSFCRALILSDGRNTALAHILPKSLIVDKYILDMSRDIGKPAKELKAAVIEVDYPYEQDLEIFCRDAGVNVVRVHRLEFSNENFDEWAIGYKKAVNALERNIAVDPKSQRVCIYRVSLNQYGWMQL